MADQISLVVFDPCEAMVSDLVKKNEVQQFDHTTEDGEKALRSWVHRIRGGKGEIEKVRKSMKADALAFGRKVDDRAKELTAPLDRMITENMKPLDEIEAEKRRRAEAIVEAERIAAEKAEQARVADLERREAVVRAAEQNAAAEREKQERIVRERRIAEEAAEQAQIDAADAIRRAESEKRDAIERAEREKQEAVEAERARAAKAAMDKAIAEENRIIAEVKEARRLAQIEAERVAIEQPVRRRGQP